MAGICCFEKPTRFTVYDLDSCGLFLSRAVGLLLRRLLACPKIRLARTVRYFNLASGQV